MSENDIWTGCLVRGKLVTVAEFREHATKESRKIIEYCESHPEIEREQPIMQLIRLQVSRIEILEAEVKELRECQK